MLTWPTYGARFFRQINGRSHWVVKIVKGTSTWLFSDADMQLTDGHVYALLSSEPSVESEVDYVTKDWSVQDVDVEIANIPYKQNTSGAWVSFADEVGAIRNAALSIYVMAGPAQTALSDGILMFSGVVADAATVTISGVKLTASDSARRKNVILPREYITDTGGASTPAGLRKSPLVWGTFNKAYDSSSEYGLVVCEPLYDQYRKFYLVAGHPCHTLSACFVSQAQLPHPSMVISPTLTANDAGRCTLKTAAPGSTFTADAYLYVDGQYRGSTSDGGDGFTATSEPQKAGDLDLTSYATVTDTNTGATVVIRAYFGWPDYDTSDSNYLNDIGKITGLLASGFYYITLDWRIVKPDITGTGLISLITLTGTVLVTDIPITSDAYGTTSFKVSEAEWDSRVLWHPRSGKNNVLSSDLPIVAVVKMNTTKTPDTAGREVFRVKYIRLVVRYAPHDGSRPLSTGGGGRPRVPRDRGILLPWGWDI